MIISFLKRDQTYKSWEYHRRFPCDSVYSTAAPPRIVTGPHPSGYGNSLAEKNMFIFMKSSTQGAAHGPQ
jgi:hypothetical protein